jgi:hypothetical protein
MSELAIFIVCWGWLIWSGHADLYEIPVIFVMTVRT